MEQQFVIRSTVGFEVTHADRTTDQETEEK